MGQKVSSLGDVFSWKNADSSKNNDGPTAGARNSPRSSIPAAASVPVCAVHGVPVAGDQQHFENIYVSNSDGASSSGGDQSMNGCEAPATTSGVETVTSKNTQTSSTKSTAGSKKLNHWVLRFNCSRPKSKSTKYYNPNDYMPKELNEEKSETCVCTGYNRTEDNEDEDDDDDEDVDLDELTDSFFDPSMLNNPDLSDEAFHDLRNFGTALNAFNAFERRSELVLPSFDEGFMDLAELSRAEFMNEDLEDRAYKERAKEIQEGIEPPPGFRPGLHIQLVEFSLPKMTIDNLTSLFHRAAMTALTAPHDMDDSQRIHTSIDYIHYLVPDLLQITNCSFYWGKMDRYEAEKLLENKPEGTFLLRDSAQEEYLFSVSFRKYGRSLHARIEQWNHLFSFDSRDPGVFASSTVCGLIEHYKDPTCCMFFEPMLTIPLHRNFTFSLQHTCRAAICSQITYDDVNQLKLPKLLKSYLKEYHYKQRVRVRIFDSEN
ncbi:uncharacterized protein LOC113556248 [Rhopalosiphum maidis]|uniref:uncharacterized protein LOC113556248 n=1 Tax=Rhopalosiphum maidis TaxID=43146 RepID=UPI000EFEDCE4|nr:uncharacterized protein LOC113556248 [Rhopalosiphum maidis]